MSLRALRQRPSGVVGRHGAAARATKMTGMTGAFYTAIPDAPVLDVDSGTKSGTLAKIPTLTGNHHFVGLKWVTACFVASSDTAYHVEYPPDPNYAWPDNTHRIDELNPLRIPDTPHFYTQPGTIAEGAGWDGWGCAIDPTRGIGYAFWRMRKESGVWRATTSHSFNYPGSLTTAAGLGRGDGLPAITGNITVQEAAAAVADTTGAYTFPHALALAVPSNYVDSNFRFPATKTDGAVAPTTSTISEGSRFQMNPTATAPTTTNKITQAVFRTLIKHGAYIVDRTGVDGPVMMNFERFDPAKPTDMVFPAGHPNGSGAAAPLSHPDAIAGAYYRAGFEYDYFPLDGAGDIPWGSMRLLARWDGL